MKKILLFLCIILIFNSCINNTDKNGKNKSEPTIEPINIAATAYNEERVLLNIELFEPARTGNIKKLEELLEKGADINFQAGSDGLSVLHVACLHEQHDTIKFLIENGADINVVDNEGFTPLFSVTDEKNLDLLKLMIEKGADVNATTIYGNTPIVASVYENNVEGVKILIEHGAEVNIKFNINEDIYEEPVYKTVLQVAEEKGYEEITKLLIDAGAEE